jgi:hypothetical protein
MFDWRSSIAEGGTFRRDRVMIRTALQPLNLRGYGDVLLSGRTRRGRGWTERSGEDRPIRRPFRLDVQFLRSLNVSEMDA